MIDELTKIMESLNAVIPKDSDQFKKDEVLAGRDSSGVITGLIKSFGTQIETMAASIGHDNTGVKIDSAVEINDEMKDTAAMAYEVGLAPDGNWGMVGVDGDQRLDPRKFGCTDPVKVGQDSFNNMNYANTLKMTVAAAMLLSKASRPEELVFPTCTFDPRQAGVKVNREVIEVGKALIRSNAAAAKFKRISISKALTKQDLISPDANILTPILETGKNDAFFITDLAADVVLDGDAHKTAPLKVGEEVDLIGVSQTKAQLTERTADESDDLDPVIPLKALYAKNGAEYYKFNVGVFDIKTDPTYTGDQLDLSMLYAGGGRLTLVTGPNAPKQASGADSAILTGLPADYVVEIGFTVSAIGNAETANFKMLSAKMEITGIKDPDGKDVTMDAGDGKTIYDALKDATMEGYDIAPRPSNANLSNIYNIGTVKDYSFAFPVPRRASLTVAEPVGGVESAIGDIKRIGKKIQDAALKSRVGAWEAMNTIFNDAKAVLVRKGELTDIEGSYIAGSDLNAYIVDSTIDLQNLSSKRSGETIEDVTGFISARLAIDVPKMIEESNFALACQQLHPGKAIKVNIIVGRSLAPYVSGVTFGQDVKVEVAPFDMPGMGDKIFVFLGVENPVIGSGTNQTVSPIHSGVRYFTPTPFVEATRSNNDAVRGLHYTPRFLHVVQAPVGIRYTVAGLAGLTDRRIPSFSTTI